MMPRFKKHIRAQTAIELAVFGAILIFMVGVIVRQALSSAYAQNQNLRAMRQAMTASYRYSGGLTGLGGADGTASHQTASILFIEDRLTADSAKYAAVDRTPYVVGASATYSHNLFLPLDVGEDYNLPVYDIFVNGKHFPFTTARFKRVELAKSCRNVGSCPAQCNADCTNTSPFFYPGNLSCQYINPCPAACGGDCSATSAQVYPVEWENNCITTVTTVSMCTSGDCIAACLDFVSNCNVSPGPPITNTQTIGCAKLYGIVYNHPAYSQWCDDAAKPCPADNLTADERFDLDRNGVPDVPAGERARFAWQWSLVMGYDAGFAPRPVWWGFGVALPPPTSTLLRGEGIGPSAVNVDVDRDLKRERIFLDSKVVDPSTGLITALWVLDQQEGDLDMTRGGSDTGPEPGLAKNTKMYSFVLGGTYLLLEEGRLYDPAFPGQYIRTAQRKDQVDLVERTIQLSNNTGRFCSGSTPNTDPRIWTAQVPNPVEACQNCASGTNIQKTCMDQTTKSIIVRSRIQDRRGRKWVTNTSGDDYVDFVVPPVP